MQKAGWRSLNEPAPSNDSPSVEPPASSSAIVDDPLPESWRSLSEASPKAPLRDVARQIPQAGPPRLPQADPPRSKSGSTARTIAIVLAVVAVIQSAFIARLMIADDAKAVSVPSLPVTITSAAVGDAVTIDGRQVGVTPYLLRVDESIHEVRVMSQQPALIQETAPPLPKSESVSDPLAPLAPSAPRSGGLRLVSPVDVQVLEGERVLGSSADGPVITAAGVHQLDFVNSEIGYRERRRVEIRAGQIIALTVTPPNGRLNINALPWAQVWIDGKEAGETPLANVALPGGPHDVVLRHPQLGERTEHVLVKSGGLTRLSITLGR